MICAALASVKAIGVGEGASKGRLGVGEAPDGQGALVGLGGT
jgi:hypothetical protein